MEECLATVQGWQVKCVHFWQSCVPPVFLVEFINLILQGHTSLLKEAEKFMWLISTSANVRHFQGFTEDSSTLPLSQHCSIPGSAWLAEKQEGLQTVLPLVGSSIKADTKSWCFFSFLKTADKPEASLWQLCASIYFPTLVLVSDLLDILNISPMLLFKTGAKSFMRKTVKWQGGNVGRLVFLVLHSFAHLSYFSLLDKEHLRLLLATDQAVSCTQVYSMRALEARAEGYEKENKTCTSALTEFKSIQRYTIQVCILHSTLQSNCMTLRNGTQLFRLPWKA